MCLLRLTHIERAINGVFEDLVMRRVVVIGAGLGGLSAALLLAADGFDVTVLEAAPAPGGKMREAMVNGRGIDVGPTVLTMRWAFEAIFAQADLSLADHVTLRPAERLARHFWGDGTQLDLFGDVERSVFAIAEFAGPAEGAAYRAFAARAGAIYETLRGGFIEGERTCALGLAMRLGPMRLPDLARIAPFQTLWSALGGLFKDPRLRQLFGRYATYCGSSPFAAPATLMLVAHVEREGVWLVEGGMARLAEAFCRAAEGEGAAFHFSRAVKSILAEGDRAVGVVTEDGARFDAEALVMNGDVSALHAGLLGPAAARATPATPPEKRSLSALTFAFSGRCEGPDLIRHNVFFCGNYRGEFDDVFKQGHLPRSPTVYICAQDRGAYVDARADRFRRGAPLTRDETRSTPASTASERFFCLVNAPSEGRGAPLTESELSSCQEAMIRQWERCGLTVTPETPMTRTTPADFAQAYPGSGGALYGRAAHGWRAAFQRPGARSRLAGLYLAGGSVHPGPGAPMAALSGRQAAAAIQADLGSTRRFHAAAMPGGMSTP
jgi:1-hydroxycarotenoid 3,4-desaturase